MLGVAKAALFGAAFAQQGPVLVSLWAFDETSDAGGVFNDLGPASLAMDIVGTWADLSTDSMVQGIGGTSAYTAGSGYATTPANHPAHNLPALTISFYYQPNSAAAKHILFAAGNGTQTGDFSIELLANGRLRAYHVGQDNVLRFFESTNGVTGTNLQVGTAYRIDLTLGSLGARIYLDGVPLTDAFIPANTNGWNNSQIKYLGVFTDGVSNPADGAFDRFRIWDRQLTSQQIAALEPAQSMLEYITTPEAHGWSAENTNTQNTAAFNAAIDDARTNAGSSSTGRGVVELIQGKTYFLRSTTGSSLNWNPALTKELSDVEIRTQGKPTRASDDQAIIMWESWAGKTGIGYQVLIQLTDVDNFLLGWVTLDGNKNSIDDVLDDVVYQGENGGLHNIVMDQDVSNITLKEVDSRMALTDGLQVKVNNEENVLIEDCNFTRNRRQGVSIGRIHPVTNTFDQFIFRRCLFNKTGDNPADGDVLGNQPAAGVDVEPDSTSSHVNGLTFDDCDFDENYGSTTNNGTVTSQGNPFGLKYDCRSTSEHVKIINCRMTNQTARNGVSGIGLDLICRGNPTFSHWLMEDNVVEGNTVNFWRFWGSTGGNGGTLVDMAVVNIDAPSIVFQEGLNDTGHSVTIWKGDFDPSVVTNGQTTITVNNGFPP